MTVHNLFSTKSTPPKPAGMLAANAAASFFPGDAQAVIYRPSRAATTSGKARTREWMLRFERRTSPVIEPLMGWTGGDDPLTQIELWFPSAEAAIAYARRQGLQYTVRGVPHQAPRLELVSIPDGERERRALRLEWVERTLGPDLIRKGVGPGRDPADTYASPQDVLRDTRLSAAEKRELLQRWALQSYQAELALANGEPQVGVSRLPEAIDALLDLEAAQRATRRAADEREAA